MKIQNFVQMAAINLIKFCQVLIPVKVFTKTPPAKGKLNNNNHNGLKSNNSNSSNDSNNKNFNDNSSKSYDCQNVLLTQVFQTSFL